MFKPKRNKTESNLSSKGQRYWSLMLVGEHGRVIPFRRFKEFAIGVAVLTILSIGALVVLGFLYFQQGQSIAGLEKEIVNLKTKNTALKNERDVLVARVGIKKASSAIVTPGSTATKDDEPPMAASPKVEPPSTPPQKSVEKEAVKKSDTEPTVSWRGDIKQFSTDFDHKRQILTNKFRIYNVSKPKKELSGRIVVVYKNKSDPPAKWMAVPHVPLVDGKPVGNQGQAFQVRNYRTMTFKAYNQKYPIPHDTARVYVFLSDGKLILSEDFKLAVSPPPKPTPSPTPKPTPTPEIEEPTPAVEPAAPTSVVAPDTSNKADGEQTDDMTAPAETTPFSGGDPTTPTSDNRESNSPMNEKKSSTVQVDPADSTGKDTGEAGTSDNDALKN